MVWILDRLMKVGLLFQRWRAQLAVVMLVGFVIVSGLQLMYVATIDRDFYDRFLKAYIPRVESARGALPPEGEIGYLSDDVSPWFMQRYFVTQYVLAPLVVRPVELPALTDGYVSPDIIQTTGNRYPIILGYFSDPKALQTEMQQNNLVLVQHIDANIVILARQ
jgi:hypothetical protein